MTSRLWESLGASSALFEIISPALSTTPRDADIIKISTVQGTVMSGMSTSAATITLAGHHRLVSDDTRADVVFTPHGYNLLAQLTGQPVALLRERFRGRIAGQTITDDVGTRGQLRKTTTLTVQDWAAMVVQMDKGAAVTTSDLSVWRLYRSLFHRGGFPGMIQLEGAGSVWHWVRFTDEDAGSNEKVITTADAVGRYAAEIGSLIRVERSGAPVAWSHDHLVDVAQEWRTYHPDPLQRHQVLSPVEWVRPVTIPKTVRWTQMATIGGTGTQTWVVSPPGLYSGERDLDMTHVWVIGGDEGLFGAMKAEVARENSTRTRVEEVTIDLLALVRRNEGTDRAQVGHLLTMNHGDPIVLGWDWPTDVAGVYFAETIQHEITRDSWRVTLSLVPAQLVTGEASPTDLAGRTWDTGYQPPTQWSGPTTTWEDSP